MTSKKTQRAIEAATADLNVLLYTKQRELDDMRSNRNYWKDSYCGLGRFVDELYAKGDGQRLEIVRLAKELTEANGVIAKRNLRIAELEAVLRSARAYAVADERNGKEDARDAASLRQKIESALPAKPLSVQQQEANLTDALFGVYKP